MQFGVDYCPVYSVIGSVLSQEIIKIIGGKEEPTLNWFCYDSQDGYGTVENFQDREKSYKVIELT